MRASGKVGLALATVGMLVAGCGGGSSGGSGSSPSAQASSPPTASVIKLGLISTIQSQAFSFKDSGQALQAAVDSINAAGGIKGHQLQAIICNDEGQASQATACANKLIQQDHVVAIGGGISPVDTPVYAAAKAANVSIFCFNGGNPQAAAVTPVFFACSGATYAYINMATVFQPGWKNISLVSYQGLPSVMPYIQQGIKTDGSSVTVHQISAPLTTADWAPIVAEAKSQHADAIISQLAATADLPLLQAETDANVKIPLLATSGQFESPEVAYASKHGIPAYVVGAYNNDPAKSKLRAQELADFKKYEPSIDDDVSDTTANPWLFPYLLKIGADNGSLTDFSVNGIRTWAEKQTNLVTGFGANLDWAHPGPIKSAPRQTNLWTLALKVDSAGQEVLITNHFQNLAVSKTASQPIS
jgi:ABC-type branched-subunit amino acid transport system substrate-binding protein